MSATEKQLLDALKIVMEYIDECHFCNGTGAHTDFSGKITSDDNCSQCGGSGKLVRQSLTSEIHIVEEAIKRASTTDATIPGNKFIPGQKVRNHVGSTSTVIRQDEGRVFTTDSHNGWYHPSKLTPIENDQI